MHVDLLIDNIGQLITLAGPHATPRRGAELGQLGVVEHAAIAIAGTNILAVGPRDAVHHAADITENTRIIEADNRVVMPGFVDPHTHPVFAGTRADEYALRVAGATYEEILARGGGILDTMRRTRAATADDLFQTARSHLDTMLRYGTTTVEAKSGYGLDTKSELKLLRVIRRLDAEHPLDVVSTFMGAHVTPPEFHNRIDDYVKLIIEQMLPAVVDEGLADYCDVWCEETIFNESQSRHILEAAQAYGLRLRLHANQLTAAGGTQLGVEIGADSVDHLERLPAEEIPRLAQSSTIATLLPGVAFTLHEPYPEARALIDAGVAVALGTDFNPGSCFTESMPMVLALACNQLRMTPAEAITAATINAAWSLNRADRIGSLEAGKQADMLVIDAPDYRHLPYHFGVNLVHTVIKAGHVVVQDGRRTQS